MQQMIFVEETRCLDLAAGPIAFAFKKIKLLFELGADCLRPVSGAVPRNLMLRGNFCSAQQLKDLLKSTALQRDNASDVSQRQKLTKISFHEPCYYSNLRWSTYLPRQVGRYLGRQIVGQVASWVASLAGRQLGRQIVGQVDSWVGRQLGRQIVGQVDSWVGRQLGRQTVRQVAVVLSNNIPFQLQINLKSYSAGIRCWNLNSRPLGHESLPITT